MPLCHFTLTWQWRTRWFADMGTPGAHRYPLQCQEGAFLATSLCYGRGDREAVMGTSLPPSLLAWFVDDPWNWLPPHV